MIKRKKNRKVTIILISFGIIIVNLMLEYNGYIKVIDFGVAKDITGKDYTNTFMGTGHIQSYLDSCDKKYINNILKNDSFKY